MRQSRLGMVLWLVFTLWGRAYSQQATDTLNVLSRAVIFFGPSQAERDSLGRRPATGFEEVLSDYLFYVGKIRPFLDSNAVSVYETSAMSFVVLQQDNVPAVFQRKRMGVDLGLIMARRHASPRVFSGVQTDDELRPSIIKYFGLGDTGGVHRSRQQVIVYAN